jgi:hypothetical protein
MISHHGLNVIQIQNDTKKSRIDSTLVIVIVIVNKISDQF